MFGVRRWPPLLLWAIWVAGLLFWTYLLVVPVDWLPPWFRFHGTGTSRFFSLSKLGHASAYATLTAFVVLLPVGWNGRLWLWALISAHTFATEWVQSYVPTRTGCWTDVAIDHFGIAAGLVLAWLLPRQWIVAPPKTEQHAR